MLQVIGIAACIAFFLFLVTSAAALTWTAICMIAGGGIGCIATFFFFHGQLERERRREDLRREREQQRLLELVYAARATGARVDVPTLEVPKQSTARITRR